MKPDIHFSSYKRIAVSLVGLAVVVMGALALATGTIKTPFASNTDVPPPVSTPAESPLLATAPTLALSDITVPAHIPAEEPLPEVMPAF